MTVKVLKILIFLDESGCTNAQVVANEFDLTVQQVGQYLGLLERVGLVVKHPRKKINGEYSPAHYCSNRPNSNPPMGD